MSTRNFLAAVVAGCLIACALGCPSKPTQSTPVVESGPDPELQGPDLFADVTGKSQIDFAYRNGEEIQPPHLAILESLGGGVGVLDFDGDGLMDIYIPGGGYFAGADNKEIRGHAGRLYRNLGGLRFADVTKQVGLDVLAGGKPWFYSHGVCVFDYNRDGWPDLLVTGWGRIALFRNESDGKTGRRFVDVSSEAALDKGVTWATSAAAADFDGDGWPDLYVCQYVDWSFANHRSFMYDGKTYDVAPPKEYNGLVHKVYHNNGNGTFTDISADAGLKAGGPKASKGLGVVAADLNGDRKPDVYVANDTVDNFLYINESTPGKIKFRECGVESFVARDGQGQTNGSMGVDVGDPEGVGRPYIWVTNYEKELHAMYKNDSTPDRLSFLFNTQAYGIAAIGQSFVGWGTGFFDYDRDGWEDIFIGNGHAIRYPTSTTRSQTPVLFRNTGGGFFKDLTVRGGDYCRAAHLARGLVLTDLDNDGHVDVVICHMNQPLTVLHNKSPDTNHWIGIELRRPDNADTVGARIILESGGRRQTRFAKGGGGYASAPDKRALFGIGASESIDKLTVVWPDGKEESWTGLKPDRYYRLTQGERNAK